MTPTEDAIDDLTDEQIDALTDDERKERAARAIAPILAEIRANPAPIEQQRSGRTSPEWLKEAFGIFAGSEAFEEAVKYGEAWRRAEYIEKGWD